MLFISAVFLAYSLYQLISRFEAGKNIVKQLFLITLGVIFILMTLIDLDKKEKQEERDRELMERIEDIAKTLKISNNEAKLVYEDKDRPEIVALANNINRQIRLFYEKNLKTKMSTQKTLFLMETMFLLEKIFVNFIKATIMDIKSNHQKKSHCITTT